MSSRSSESTEFPIGQHCHNCQKLPATSELRRCSKCKTVKYCSEDCQRNNWRTHKHVCMAPTDPTPSRQLTFQCAPKTTKGCSNVVIFLHGLGDTEKPFVKLAAKMALPQTQTICVRGPVPILDIGFGWFPAFEADGNLIDPMTAPQTTKNKTDQRRLNGLRSTRVALHSLLESLTDSFAAENIFLLGFGHGGIAAIDAAMTWKHKLGGVIAVSGGVFLPEQMKGINTTSTPRGQAMALAQSCGWTHSDVHVMITHGQHDENFPIQQAKSQRSLVSEVCPNTTWHAYQTTGAMASSAEEMKDIFSFLAPKLKLDGAMTEMATKDETIIDVTGKIDPSTMSGFTSS
eukprot:m.70696 g.70696  ORF g.70696 m.70696 type:complete len:345 (-) comp24262_c0_seq1:20-1054(-)